MAWNVLWPSESSMSLLDIPIRGLLSHDLMAYTMLMGFLKDRKHSDIKVASLYNLNLLLDSSLEQVLDFEVSFIVFITNIEGTLAPNCRREAGHIQEANLCKYLFLFNIFSTIGWKIRALDFP